MILIELVIIGIVGEDVFLTMDLVESNVIESNLVKNLLMIDDRDQCSLGRR